MGSWAEAYAESAELRDAYRHVWQKIVTEMVQIIEDPRKQAHVGRLNAFRRMVESELGELDTRAATWVSKRMPFIYEMAALDANPAFTWTAAHRDAFAKHAADVYGDLLKSTRYMRRETKLFIRKAARLRALEATATESGAKAAKLLAQDLAENGIAAITYRNGARVGLETYSEMVIRTKTAVAYNEGTLRAGADLGVEWFEVFDGPDCGWSFHESSDLALGKIVHIDEALSFPISHPNCRRAFGPRPDIQSKKDALAARGGQTTRRQAAAQRSQDSRRRAGLARRTARRRAARQGA